jgi:hypothetical protein
VFIGHEWSLFTATLPRSAQSALGVGEPGIASRVLPGTAGCWRVFPFWQAKGRIVRLRFDLYDGAEFGVAGFRVGELESPGNVVARDFTFSHRACGWRAAAGGHGEQRQRAARRGEWADARLTYATDSQRS